MICPCGTSFEPSVFKGEIQLLCDPCSLAHLHGYGSAAKAWVPRSNVISLFTRFATGGRPSSDAKGIASGVGGGEVAGVTPVPLRRLRG